jgi:hypothetical protein
MIHPIKNIRCTIASIKVAFHLMVNTLENLTAAIQSNTAEQQLLRDKLDTLVEHSGFMVRAKKSELTRAGHRVE